MILAKSLKPDLFYKCFRFIKINYVPTASIYNRSLIGNREWVGWGTNGTPSYTDVTLIPFPAIRFKENSNELLALREKEKGDWRKLTIEEKKTLYRASFRLTFSEMLAPTGNWKSILAMTLFFTTIGICFFIMTKLSWGPLPESFSEESRRHQLRKMLVLRYGHLTGISTKWDYELDDWKK